MVDRTRTEYSELGQVCTRCWKFSNTGIVREILELRLRFSTYVYMVYQKLKRTPRKVIFNEDFDNLRHCEKKM